MFAKSKKIFKFRKYCNYLFLFACILFFFFLIACNFKGEGKKESKRQFAKFKVIISDENDDFIDLKHLDYDRKSKAIYGLYFGMQRNMARHYYRLSLTPPYKVVILGVIGQGPDKLKNPPLSIRFLDDLVMVGSGKTIKLFDRNENFVSIIDGLPVYPADFYFKDGILSLLTVRYIHQAKDEDDVFFRYDIGNKKILKSIKFGDIKRVFEKNEIDFSKLEAYTNFEGKVINEDIAVISIPNTNLFNRNAFAILDLKNNKITFFKAKPHYEYSTFSSVFISSVSKDKFLVIEKETVCSLQKARQLSTKSITKKIEKRRHPLLFCIHKVSMEGKEEKVYSFSLKEKDLLVVNCHDLIEIEPEKFVLCVRFTHRDDYTDAIILWDAN